MFQEAVAIKKGMISLLDRLESVDKLCYLRDLNGAGGGGAEEASRARARCAWAKFRNWLQC